MLDRTPHCKATVAKSLRSQASRTRQQASLDKLLSTTFLLNHHRHYFLPASLPSKSADLTALRQRRYPSGIFLPWIGQSPRSSTTVVTVTRNVSFCMNSVLGTPYPETVSTNKTPEATYLGHVWLKRLSGLIGWTYAVV
jgi:hypothetical protein